MCDICRETLGSCVRRHAQKDCYLIKTKYCTACALYGHTFSDCTKTMHDVEYIEKLIPPCYIKELEINTNTVIIRGSMIKKSRRPAFLEDLIPVNYLKDYSISTSTPLNRETYEITPMKPTIDVINNPKAIRDLLKAYGQMPKKDNRNKDKYKVYLEKFAKKNNYNIMYHESEINYDDNLSEHM